MPERPYIIIPGTWIYDRALAVCSDFAQTVLRVVFQLSDEHGRFSDDPLVIKGEGFALRPAVRTTQVTLALQELMRAGALIRKNSIDGRSWIEVAEHLRYRKGQHRDPRWGAAPEKPAEQPELPHIGPLGCVPEAKESSRVAAQIGGSPPGSPPLPSRLYRPSDGLPARQIPSRERVEQSKAESSTRARGASGAESGTAEGRLLAPSAEQELLDKIYRIDMREAANGGMWRNRMRGPDELKALRNALSDYAAKTPEQRAQFGSRKSKGAALTDLWCRCLAEIEGARKSA